MLSSQMKEKQGIPNRSDTGSIYNVFKWILSHSLKQTTTARGTLEEKGEYKHTHTKVKERDDVREGLVTAIERGPSLSHGLLSGRVCASLAACLSSPLLSILLKTICLLIIHKLLFWTDMFSLH